MPDDYGRESYFLVDTVKPVYNDHALVVQNLWLLLTGSRCSEEGLCYKWDYKMMAAVGRWSLFGGGRELYQQVSKIFVPIYQGKFPFEKT